MSKPAAPRAHAEAVISKIVTALDDKKAADIRVIDITGKSSVADYLVVATGTSDPHLRSMRIEIEKALDEAGIRIDGVESQPESGWTVVATFEAMVHLFRADQRANFRIEQLWKDGVEIAASKVLGKTAEKPTGFVDVSAGALSKKTPAKKPAAKAKSEKAAKPAAKKTVKKAAPAKKAAAKKTETKTAKAPAAKAPAKKAAVKAEKAPAKKTATKAAKPEAAKPAKKTPAKKTAAESPKKAGVITRAAKKKA